MKFLAVDIGASSGRTIVGDLSDGRIALTETHRFENAMVETNGQKRWDIYKLVNEVRTGIRKSGHVDGIGIDTWGVDYGLLDAGGELLALPFAYRDARNDAAMPQVYEKISREALYSISGLQEMSFNTVFQVQADLMMQPVLLGKARRLLFMPELLTYLLTGEALNEYTICSTSGLLDARTRTWSDSLLEALDFPRHLFGEVHLPGTPAGYFEGTPVYLSGGHDTASAVVAVPAVDGGDWAYISSGTWSLIGAELDEPVLTPEAQAANFTNEGGAAGKIRFLKNVNGLWLIQECRRMWAEQGISLTFAEIAAAAESSPYNGSIDPNAPQFLAPANMLTTLAETCAATGQPVPANIGEFARCCYLSLARAYRRELDGLAKVTGKRFERLHIVGGGSQATLLNQLTADSCGIPVVTGPVEATAIGNIGLIAMANGHFADLAAIRAAIAVAFPTTTYLPRG